VNGGIDTLIENRRLCVFLGEGGVGKTSCAAATAVAAALRGRRTAVLTVDPAPRLGDALGLPTIDDIPRGVREGLLETAPGSVVALRLDAKRTFDRLVEDYAADAETAERLLQNPIYRTVSDSLGGTEAYMAFQRLHELVEDDAFDFVVLDTPPTIDAGDLLQAPGRLERLLETDAAKMLADPAAMLLRAGSKVAAATVSILLTAVERAFGSGLRSDIAEFATGFEAVLRALTERTGRIEELLGAPDTAIAQVLRPSVTSVVRAERFRRSLADRGLEVEVVVANRLTPPGGRSAERRLPVEAPAGTAAALRRIRQTMDAMRAEENAATARMFEGLDDDRKPAAALVESLGPDLYRIEALEELAARLFGRPAPLRT
jgi:anion-transporting  ArsA/GET3 family ATPase